MNNSKRYALVIGNFEYENLERLETPGNDCIAVGEKLKESLGFQVTFAVNKTRGELYTLLDTFTENANDNIGDIVFYYSGHGYSIQGKNYIIPIDGTDSSKRSAKNTYFSLDDIINSLAEFRLFHTVPIIIILDCCRSEYITQGQEHQNNDLVKDDGRHANIFIMYATGNNQIAPDGNGRNGTFTELLLTRMDTDEDVETISKDILINLHSHPNYRNARIPWTGSSLFKPYSFRTGLRRHNTRYLQPILVPIDGVLRLNALTVSMNDVLGHGSHGTVVYKGTFDGREVAVKRLLRTFYDITEREVQLLRESDDHPNVIRYYFQEQHDQFVYIALEFCQSSLYDAIEKPLSSLASLLARNPARVLYQIIAGIHHLHSLNIIHRDIKPQNILITSAKPRYSRENGYGNSSQQQDDIRVLISDFGLCKKLEVDQSSFNNTVNAPGTIGWRAPELLFSLIDINSSVYTTNQSTSTPTRNTRAIDIFPTGCLFYYVLSKGDHPFGDRLWREINILQGNSSLEKLSSMNKEGVEAKDLIERMISSDPRCRPSAKDIMLHPYFWTPSQRLVFLQDVSDLLENESRNPLSLLLQKLEHNANNVIGPDWCEHMDQVLVKDLSKFRKYDGKKVRDLLRALRNGKHHWHSLPEILRRALGEPPDEYLYYFTSRFPKLLLHVYYVVIEDEKLRTGNTFKSYFTLPPGV